MKKIMPRFALVLLSVVVAFNVSAMTEKAKTQMIERIKPVGEACQAGDPKCEVAVASEAARSGDAVYEASCTTCHAFGVAGAPKLGEKADWKSRIAAGKDSLYNNAINGIGAMPPKGACASCSDEEIKAAVDYMVSKSK